MPSPTHPRLWKPPRPLPLPLHTPRLRLDAWQPSDAPALWQAIEESRTSLSPWMPWALTSHRDPEETLEVIQGWMRRRQAPEPDEIFLGIFDRATGAVLGGTGYHLIVEDLAQAEIGYWIHVARRGAGLCTEAVSALLTSGFHDWGFRRLVVQCSGSNRASQRVAEKLGLPLERRERLSRWIDHLGWDDGLAYGVLAEEWDVKAQRLRQPRAPLAR